MKPLWFLLLIASFALWGCPQPISSPEEGDVEPYVSIGDAGFATYSKIPDTAAMPPPPPLAPEPKLSTSKNNYTTPHFVGSGECAVCHNGIVDGAGNDVSIIKDWSSTMMANAARDPYWQAKVESELKRAPGLKTLIDDKCTVCHMPMANIEAHKQKLAPVMFGEGFLNPKHQHFDPAMAGVSCTLCHQIKDTEKLGTIDGFTGGFEIESFADKASRKIYGPYLDVETTPMRNNVSYTPTGSKHISDAKLCSTCHNVMTAFVDATGKVIPKNKTEHFPEQATYSEWKASRYANPKGPQSCQWCHMTVARKVKISDGPPWISERDVFRRHDLVGGNLFMLELMKNNKALLGIQADNFEWTLKKTKETLESAAEINILNPQFDAGRLLFRVQVRNKSGHKLPTGYPSRRVFLHVVVKAQQGNIPFESGKVLSNGHIVGVDADLHPHKYEPHYDRITRPDQVQVYESIMANSDDQVTYTLLRAAKYKKDNRLLPDQFDKTKAPADAKVIGPALNDPNFIGGTDIVTYDLRGFPKGKYTLEIALKYQSISYRSALDLFQDRQLPYTKRFMTMFLQSKQFVQTIHSTSLPLENKTSPTTPP